MEEGSHAPGPLDELQMHPLEAILTFCREAAPDPWYPSLFVQKSGIPLERLDPYLDQLRLGGLVRLTDWVQGRGQGYVLTPEGAEVLQNARRVEELKTRGVPRKAAPAWGTPNRASADTTAWDRGEQIRAALLNPTPPRFTFLLLLANILVFLAGLAMASRNNVPLNKFVWESDQQVLLNTGAATVAHVVVRGQWWRLLSYCFVHIGLLHLALNMYGLIIFGPLLERLFGHWRFLLLYLISGFGGGCLGILLQPEGLLGGASGSLCGLIAAFGVWTFLNRQALPPQMVASWLRNVLINSILIVFVSTLHGVSWSGHLGGAVAGLFAAALLNVQRFGRPWQRWAALVGLFLIPLGFYELLYQAPRYSQRWTEIVAREEWVAFAGDLREVQQIYQEARPWNAQARAENLVEEKPARRRRPEVRETIAALSRARSSLTDAAELLRGAGPFRTPGLNDTLLAQRKVIENQIQVLDLYHTCLDQEKEWTPEDEQKVKRLQGKRR